MAKILIIEDNPDLLHVLQELLATEHDVYIARRGEEGVDKARQHEPDIVILDLQLPKMDGIEAGQWIKQDAAPREVPVIALTAMAQTGDSEAVLRSGCCDEYMSKPASLDEIRQKVQELLQASSEAV